MERCNVSAMRVFLTASAANAFSMGSAHETEEIGFCRTLGENGRIGTVSPRKQA